MIAPWRISNIDTAALVPALHRFVITQETVEGSYVRLEGYTMQKARRLNGNGSVAYVGGNDMTGRHVEKES